ncbi:MAG: hypothetical protein HYZ88_00990, partial [Candidatus Omnitrophica bacterium]|nr:hypothetical protein [Candidatus Omnitrophota bacterium]
ISTHLNWGTSYLVNDGYKRFLVRQASDRHYLLVSRLLPFGLAAGAMLVALSIHSIGQAFTLILNLTAGIGPVYALRWLWWRVNPWSEIAAMVASLPVLLARPFALTWLGLPHGLLIELLFMVIATACVWLPVTLLTPPVDQATLKRFYSMVRPPGFWKPVAMADRSAESWGVSVLQWGLGTVALLATTIGPLDLLLGRFTRGTIECGIALAGWVVLFRTLLTAHDSSSERSAEESGSPATQKSASLA